MDPIYTYTKTRPDISIIESSNNIFLKCNLGRTSSKKILTVISQILFIFLMLLIVHMTHAVFYQIILFYKSV